jgi:hypothetical protein
MCARPTPPNGPSDRASGSRWTDPRRSNRTSNQTCLPPSGRASVPHESEKWSTMRSPQRCPYQGDRSIVGGLGSRSDTMTVTLRSPTRMEISGRDSVCRITLVTSSAAMSWVISSASPLRGTPASCSIDLSQMRARRGAVETRAKVVRSPTSGSPASLIGVIVPSEPGGDASGSDDLLSRARQSPCPAPSTRSSGAPAPSGRAGGRAGGRANHRRRGHFVALTPGPTRAADAPNAPRRSCSGRYLEI